MKLLPYYVNSLVITSLLQKHCLGLRFYYQWWNASVEGKHTIRTTVQKRDPSDCQYLQLVYKLFACDLVSLWLVIKSITVFWSESLEAIVEEITQYYAVIRGYCCYWCGRHCLPCPMVYWCIQHLLTWLMELSCTLQYLLSYSFAPFIGWLADDGFGRYEVIEFGSIASVLASLLYYFAMFAGESASTLSTVLYSIAFVIVSFLFISYAAAMLPFLTDQIIGATSDELSAVVRW